MRPWGGESSLVIDLSNIDAQNEIQALASRFDEFTKTLPPSLADVSRSLADRIGIHDHAERFDWISQFSPLTLLYPSLQVEFHENVDPECVREATLAHFLLLIHSFVEDRMLDGQIELNRAEFLFTKTLFSEAMNILDAFGDNQTDWSTRLLRDYVSAQIEGYDGSDIPHRAVRESSRIRKIAPGRGYLGAIATMELVSSCGSSPTTQRVVKNAFDALLMAMQWEDDMEDWMEDVAKGDINILLHLLQRSGRDPYSHAPSATRVANVGYALCEEGIIATAAMHAKRWYKAASDRQRQLGCHTLAQLIESRAARMDDLAKRAVEKIENEVLLQLVVNDSI